MRADEWSRWTSHSLFFLAKDMGDNTLGVFDLPQKTYTVFKLKGNMWIDTTGEYEILGDQLAFRFTPLHDSIAASFMIQPSESIASGGLKRPGRNRN